MLIAESYLNFKMITQMLTLTIKITNRHLKKNSIRSPLWLSGDALKISTHLNINLDLSICRCCMQLLP
jgi:hypothetical protein